MPEILENGDANLTPRMRNLVSLLWSEWKDLEQQIVAMNEEVEQIASSDPACQQLRQIPGIGPLVATAIVAAIGNGSAFRKGREFSSWLGLVPRQHSTGGNARLFGISKRGNCGSCLCMVPAPPSSASSESDRRSVHGSMLLSDDHRSRSSLQRRPTSWPASPGRSWQAATTTAQQRSQWPLRQARKRRLRLGSANALPLYRTTTTARVPTRSATDSKDERTVPNGVLATCSRKWSYVTVPFIRKSSQRNSSWPGESVLHRKAGYICADLSFALRFSLAVRRRTIHLRELRLTMPQYWSRITSG